MMINGGPDHLRITATNVANTAVLTVHGLLDHTTYVALKDAIIRAALDEPCAVVIDITELAVGHEPALAVFTSAHWQVAEWPNIPIGLVCPHARGQAALRRNGVTRYVPVYPTLHSATTKLPAEALRTHKQRSRATLPAIESSSRRCRELVTQWLTTWSRTDFIHAVSTVATELVETAISYADLTVSLRLQSDGSTMTVVVQHTGTKPRMPPESDDDTSWGADIVAATSRVWGSYTTAAGTTVWAVIGPENRF